jgi:sugar phosphate isomerase/epimerase
MILSGFTDEVSTDIDVQISITKDLGWEFLSARTIGKRNIHDISEREFEEIYGKLDSAGIKVAEFGTLIGNWSKHIDSDWNITLEEVRRCISRMKKLNVRYARIMSYAQKPWGEDQKEEKRFERVRMIHRMFADEGLEALHENCMNWGGFSFQHTQRLIEEVPGLRLIFDTGNPIFQKDRSKEEPFPMQDTIAFYENIKGSIAHVHIKDAIWDNDKAGPVYTFPGEGQGNIEFIIQDLFNERYKGFIVIEPHMGKVFHESAQDDNQEKQYEVYYKYGKKMERILKDVETT